MLKKILLIFCIILFSYNSSFAIEEVVLDVNDEEHFYDNLLSHYQGTVHADEDLHPVFKLFTEQGLTFENAPIASLKFSFLYAGQLGYFIKEKQENSWVYDTVTVLPGFRVKFNDNKSMINVSYNLVYDPPGDKRNNFSKRFMNLYYSYDFNKNQRIVVGQGRRLPVNYDGSLSRMEQDFTLRSQIGRHFGNYRSVGVRNIGKYKYLDYDLGVYDATRYMEDFCRGYDFTGYVMLKPFADFENSIKTLRIGSGYNVGEYNASYNIYSFFLGYDYKKLHFKAEYSNADGCNSLVYSRNKADGFYSSIAYDLTSNLAFHARYDYFNNDKTRHNQHSQEYTVGFIYHICKNLKVFFDFVRQENENGPDSNLILFATRFYI